MKANKLKYIQTRSQAEIHSNTFTNRNTLKQAHVSRNRPISQTKYQKQKQQQTNKLTSNKEKHQKLSGPQS